MIEPIFIALIPFDPSDGPAWAKYYEWIKIPGLTEVISLDILLCKRIMTEILAADLDHTIPPHFRVEYIDDLPYLMTRTADAPRRMILGIYHNPTCHIDHPPAGGFRFIGYDLIEDLTQISALTNCGGFPDVYSNAELNQYGLIGTFERASEIHRILPERHPDQEHASCDLYAIWKMEENR